MIFILKLNEGLNCMFENYVDQLDIDVTPSDNDMNPVLNFTN